MSEIVRMGQRWDNIREQKAGNELYKRPVCSLSNEPLLALTVSYWECLLRVKLGSAARFNLNEYSIQRDIFFQVWCSRKGEQGLQGSGPLFDQNSIWPFIQYLKFFNISVKIWTFNHYPNPNSSFCFWFLSWVFCFWFLSFFWVFWFFFFLYIF